MTTATPVSPTIHPSVPPAGGTTAPTTFTTAAAVLGSWANDVQTGAPPERFEVSPPFDGLDLRRGRLVMLGGAPGQGKTAALMQVTVDALRANPGVRALVADVEMPPGLLLERCLARLAGVPLTAIADRAYTGDQPERLRVGLGELTGIAPRLAFATAPFDLARLAAAGTAFNADLLVLDYLQRFVGTGVGTPREQLDGLVGTLRRVCDRGAVVLAAAAVARQKSDRGSTYAGLTLASFRGSSELEFGADACYLLEPAAGGEVTLRCEKNRYGPPVTIELAFDRDHQAFRPVDPNPLARFDAARPVEGVK